MTNIGMKSTLQDLIYPVCERIYSDESVCIHHKVLMGSTADMDEIAMAIEKIYNNVDELL